MEATKEDILDLMTGFFRTKALTSALELGVFEALAAGPATAQTVCDRRDLPLATGKRLLIALVAMGLVRRDGDDYSLTDAARQHLVRDSAQWLGGLARHIDSFLYPLWSHTAKAVREDRDQRATVFGDERSWFDVLYGDPQDVADFQSFLSVLAEPFIQGLVQDFDFSPYKRFMDVGSGLGTLPIAVAERYPELDVAICELPEAARHVSQQLREKGLGERIQVVEGDVIAGNLPKGEHDLIHLGWMLHDYAPETQARILSNLYEALPEGGVFMASETPLADDESGPLFTSLLSINMLVSTDGGVESTGAQYLERFRAAGFANVRQIDIPGPRTLFVGEKASQ